MIAIYEHRFHVVLPSLEASHESCRISWQWLQPIVALRKNNAPLGRIEVDDDLRFWLVCSNRSRGCILERPLRERLARHVGFRNNIK